MDQKTSKGDYCAECTKFIPRDVPYFDLQCYDGRGATPYRVPEQGYLCGSCVLTAMLKGLKAGTLTVLTDYT